jgi:hypothetical protein
VTIKDHQERIQTLDAKRNPLLRDAMKETLKGLGVG